MFFILIILAVSGSFPAVFSVEVYTEPSLTAVRGRTITLPCHFDVEHPTGVYWFRHNAKGAPFVGSEENLLARFFRLNVDEDGDILVNGGPRFNMTSDYSLMISNVTVGDETTYSCQVAKGISDSRNETDLRVIALANPLHPKVSGCHPSSSGSCAKSAPCCVYTVGGIVLETFSLTCSVNLVRPAVNLTWTGGNGEERPTNYLQTITTEPDVNGLVNVSTILEVSKPEIGENFICKASGEGVNGTAHVTASIQYPPEKSGLSDGGLAGIIIFFLLLLIGTVVALLWYKGKVPLPIIGKRRLKEDDDPEAVKLSPQESELKTWIDIIKDYKPGDFSPLEARDDRELPDKIRLAVFGVTHAGKSSLVRSFSYAVTGDFIPLEVSKALSTGGVTIASKKYRITDYISVIDNRGLRDLDVKLIPEVMDQIRGESKELDKRDRIVCPVLVFDARQPIDALQTFLPAFITAVREEYSTHPPVIFTHREDVKDQRDIIAAQAAGIGALDQRLYFVENITEKPTEPCIERRLEFLKILKELLHFADENMCFKLDQIDMGGGSDNVQPLSVQVDEDKSNTNAAKKKKGRFSFWGK